MGCKASKEIKKDIELVKNNLEKYVTHEQIDNIKNSIKESVGNVLEASIPIFTSLLTQKIDLTKKHETNQLTKSFVTSTFKNITEKVDTIGEKLEEIDKKKINKPVLKTQDELFKDSNKDYNKDFVLN